MNDKPTPPRREKNQNILAVNFEFESQTFFAQGTPRQDILRHKSPTGAVVRVEDPPEVSLDQFGCVEHVTAVPFALSPLTKTAKPPPRPTGCMSTASPARCHGRWDERSAALRHTRDHQTWLRGNAGAHDTFPLSIGRYLHSQTRQSRSRDPRAACRPPALRAVVGAGMKGQQHGGTPETARRGSGAMRGRTTRFRCPLAAISTHKHGRAAPATHGLHVDRQPCALS